ncbi:MAG TPA: hypothetical protein VIU41_15090 [Geobacteraceae bacterium]
MQVHLKAALLSAFVLPGLGQIVKGDRVKGGILIVLVNGFLLTSLFMVLRGLGPLLLSARFEGPETVASAITQLQQQTPGARWLLAGFVLLWVYGIIDAAFATPPPRE